MLDNFFLNCGQCNHLIIGMLLSILVIWYPTIFFSHHLIISMLLLYLFYFMKQDNLSFLIILFDTNYDTNESLFFFWWLDNLSPFAFEKHAGKENNRWKHNIWVFIDGYKVPLIKTTLLKFYNMSPKNAKRPHKLVLHRDEFIKCTKCSKRRRFYRRSKNECRSYHDALANANFQCSDIPFDK